MKRLPRTPMEMMRHQATGKLPDREEPVGPLIQLLESIPPRDRLQIVGVTICSELGYSGSRQFRNAAQALEWCKPTSAEVDTPAECLRIVEFREHLYLEDLLAHSTSYPETLTRRLKHLLRPERHC